jgi:ABC-type transporter Mla subunit MlaD
MSTTMRRITGIIFSSRALMLGALAAAAVAGSAFLGLGSPSHEVEAHFVDANGLVSGNEIRVAGIQAGTVKSVAAAVDPGNGQQYARVILDVDEAHWPLHKGAQLAVRPKGVLSNVFVALSPGNTSSPAIDPTHVFGVKETSSPVNLDEFSNLFDKNVTESIRTQIQEGVVAFGGSGASDTNAVIKNLNPLTADLSPLTSVLAARTPELDRLNTEFDTITRELASEDANLRGLIENGNTFLGTIASNASSVQGTLVHAAGTLASLDAGLKGEEANLAAIFAKGPAALDKAKTFADLFVPIVNTVNPYMGDLQQLLVQFMSATGYGASNPPPPAGPGGTQISSRIDATLGGTTDGTGRSAVACGGQWWGSPPCPYPPADQGGTSHPVSTSSMSSSGASASTAAQSSSPRDQSVPSMYGGLFQ